MINKQKYLDELINEGIKSMEIISHLENRLKKSNIKNKKSNKLSEKVFWIKNGIIRKASNFVSKYTKQNITSINDVSEIRVVSVLDEFSYQCFKEELNLYSISKNEYKKEIRKIKPHVLLVESAWKGNGGQWAVSRDLREIEKLVYFCKRKGIITVFWNKEDPVHFYNFIKKAQHFDFVFTTDDGVIDEYKTKLQHKNIFPLPFAAQPKLHNPITKKIPLKKSVFAGTFYRNKYQERFATLYNMLCSAKKYGLDIYDRNYNSRNKIYEFPEIFQENILGNLSYGEIDEAYKGYMVNLNINTVTHSNTMFSRRVFEVLASNRPLISNYSLGIKKMFPNIVLLGKTMDDFDCHFKKLFNDHFYYQKISLLGLRTVLTEHTYRNRVDTILNIIGFNIKTKTKKILMISKVDSLTELKNITTNYEKQTYKNKQLLIISDKVNTEKYQVLKSKDIPLVKKIIDESNVDYIGVFDYNHFYGSNYLSDLLMHDQYLSNCVGISKGCYYTTSDGILSLKNTENEYTFMNQNLLDRSIIKKGNEDVLIKYLLTNNYEKTIKCFSIDNFNFVENYDINLKEEISKKVIL